MSQSLARGLAILGALSGQPQTLGELSDLLDVHKSTVLRLLQTLEADRFVTHDAAHRYTLGSRLFDLSTSALNQRDVRIIARPHLEALNALTGQTVHLASFESGEVVYIDKLDALQGVRMYSRIGLRAPLYCTAVGKVLVAGMPLDARVQLARAISFVALTPHTITNEDDYLAELDRVAAQGWAEDRAEHERFINCVAAGIQDATGRTVAAVSVSVPEMALDRSGVLALLPDVRAAARAVSSDLGFGAPAGAGSPSA